MTKTVMQTAVCIAIILTNNFAEAADWILHPQRKGRQIKDDVEYEEVVEAAHQRFDELWKRYKVCQVDRESHGSNLFNFLKHALMFCPFL